MACVRPPANWINGLLQCIHKSPTMPILSLFYYFETSPLLGINSLKFSGMPSTNKQEERGQET